MNDPATIRLNLQHQKLSLLILLEIDHKELVRLNRRHFPALWAEVTTKDETSANGPNEWAAQVLYVPEPDTHGWRLLQKWVLWHERYDTLLTIEGDEAT